MNRLSLQSLLLLVACVAISIAWLVQSQRPPDIYYLHVFTNRNFHTATAGISPGIPFHVRFSSTDGEEVFIHGTVEREGSQFPCKLNMFAENPGYPDNFSKAEAISLDTLVKFSGFYSVLISETSDPSEIQLPKENPF